MLNWKTACHDGIYGFWFKKFTSIHDRLVLEMNKCQQTTHVPEWMTKGKTTLIQKDPNKGTASNNYRPITCLPMMCGLFPEEQKGCFKGSRSTAELLYKDQHILNESTTRRKFLYMAWSDYKRHMIWFHIAG